MTSDKVICLLEERVLGSQGTITFLKVIRNVINAFSTKNFTPLERIRKMWYTVFLLWIWREFVSSKKKYTLKNNFVTQNCHSCIELNAHNLVLIILALGKENKPDQFLPFLYNSQTCEEFFRQIRSFTSTYSTKANCSVKEILERISKIQLLNDITTNTTFKFPRVRNMHQFSDQINYELPTKGEIFKEIVNCQKDAIKKAIELGMLAENHENRWFECPITPLQMKPQTGNENKSHVNTNKIIHLKKVELKNFAHKFINQAVPETSPYVEISTGLNRHMVKKTSLGWLLRPEPAKLSSGRIIRVRGVKKQELDESQTNINPAITNKNRNKKRKKFGLLYNPYE